MKGKLARCTANCAFFKKKKEEEEEEQGIFLLFCLVFHNNSQSQCMCIARRANTFRSDSQLYAVSPAAGAVHGKSKSSEHSKNECEDTVWYRALSLTIECARCSMSEVFGGD